MNLIVQKSEEVQKRLTNHGIGFYTSGQLFLEEYYALAAIGKDGLNTLDMYRFRRIVAWAETDILKGWKHTTVHCNCGCVNAKVVRLGRPTRLLY